MIDATATKEMMHGYVREAIFTVVLSVGGWVLAFPVRTLFTSLKGAWDGQAKILSDIQQELKDERLNCLDAQVTLLADVKKELELQRVNFLANMASSTEKQVELLAKAVITLEAMHLAQVEMTGFLKGKG